MLAKIILSSSFDQRAKKIAELLQERSLNKPHPDLLYIEAGEKLGVEQARKIKHHFAYKPLSAKGKVVVIEAADNMTDEAQNALLKTIEELPEEGLILLGAASEYNFLPTVLSRCESISLPDPTSPRTPTSEVGYEKEIEKLLESTIEQRFEYIEKLKEREEFLQALLDYFHKSLNLQTRSADSNFLNELLEAEKWAKQNVNIRGILEYLMLIMPKST